MKNSTQKKKKSPAGRRNPGLRGELEQAGSSAREATYVFRLYVSGSTLRSALAVENIKRICEQYLKNRYDLEVIDIYQQPDLAREEQIVAVPTLIKLLPLPLGKLIGDLSNLEKVLGLDLGRAGLTVGGRRKKVG
jgi:circadian clock protein KaiB